MGLLTGKIKEKKLALELGVSVSTLRSWRRKGYGPSAYKLGKLVVYDLADVTTFLDGLDGGVSREKLQFTSIVGECTKAQEPVDFPVSADSEVDN